VSDAQAKVAELISDIRIAMLTTVAPDGRLMSHPMATQDTEFDGTVRFIAERTSQKVSNLEANPQVNVAFSGSGSWVSLSGTARVVSDPAELEKYWDTFTDAWLEGGPDNPNNVLIEVDGTSAEYWDGPGSKVIQVMNLVKAKVTGQRYDGDNEEVDLSGQHA
jgi:general stress protein 26